MARLTAKGAVCPQALQRTVTELWRGLQAHQEAWQDVYGNFKPHLANDQRARLKALGRTLFRFDLRFRWAIGVTALQLDDRIVTKASTGATRQGYFLLMRLVDLWFSLDLAFDLYQALFVPKHVENPNVLLTVRQDAGRRLRTLKAAEQVALQQFEKRFSAPEKRERCVAYLRGLADEAEGSLAGQLTAEAARNLERKKRLEAHQLLGAAQTIRNRYVHGGETASTKIFPAQEKIPLLRLLTGTTQVASLVLASAGAEEMLRQLRKQVGI